MFDIQYVKNWMSVYVYDSSVLSRTFSPIFE